MPTGAARLLPSNWDPTVRRSILLCFVVLAFGTAGYTFIEGWSPWRSLFFSLVTLTTVGYGDYGLSDAGERFTAVLMIGGIGTVSYSASQFIQYAATRAIQPERRMIHAANHMRDHYIVCGLGRTGQRVVRRLLDEGHDVVAIDPGDEAVERARLDGVTALKGDATDDMVLQHAGIERATAVAAVTSSDGANAMICLTARALNDSVLVTARAEREESVMKLCRAGATSVISPSRYGGDGIAESLVRPEVAGLIFGLENGKDGVLRFAEIAIDGASPHCGRTVADIGEANPRLVFVAARSADGELVMRPSPERVLESGDTLVVAGDCRTLQTSASVRIAA